MTAVHSGPLAGRAAVAIAALAVLVALVEIGLDVATWIELDIASIYGIPLVLAAVARSRRLIWGLLAALLFATFSVYVIQTPAHLVSASEPYFINRVLDAAALLLTSGLLDLWTRSLDVRDAQARLLADQNRKLEMSRDTLAAREAQIMRQNEELQRRRAEAEESSARKTRLLAAVSHDIRTPVSTITVMAELILHAAGDPGVAAQLPRMAQRLKSNAASLAGLLSDMLDRAQFDLGYVERRDTVFSPDEVVAAKCRELQPLAEAKGLRLHALPSQCGVRVRSDPVGLGRILSNLIGNAIKFTREGGVSVGTELAADGAVIIAVEDTGIGIAREQLDRIFDEFAQLDASGARGEGAPGWGLGLTICRRLAALLDATIGVESVVGRGTRFTLRVPTQYVVDAAPAELRSAPSLAARDMH